jgi:hypothetical protein
VGPSRRADHGRRAATPAGRPPGAGATSPHRRPRLCLLGRRRSRRRSTNATSAAPARWASSAASPAASSCGGWVVEGSHRVATSRSPWRSSSARDCYACTEEVVGRCLILLDRFRPLEARWDPPADRTLAYAACSSVGRYLSRSGAGQPSRAALTPFRAPRRRAPPHVVRHRGAGEAALFAQAGRGRGREPCRRPRRSWPPRPPAQASSAISGSLRPTSSSPVGTVDIEDWHHPARDRRDLRER